MRNERRLSFTSSATEKMQTQNFYKKTLDRMSKNVHAGLARDRDRIEV
jgi:hypothetical protein